MQIKVQKDKAEASGSLRCLYNSTHTRHSLQLLFFQALPRSCASGSTALSTSSGERCREEDSVWVLVLLHPWLSSYWGTAASHSPDNHTERPLTKGTTWPCLCYSSVFPCICYSSIRLFPLAPGACVCASGVVGHAGRLPSVPGCSRGHGVSSYILHPFLLLARHCCQRAAPRSQSSSAGWDLPSDTHTGHKGKNTWVWWHRKSLCISTAAMFHLTFYFAHFWSTAYLHLPCVLVSGLPGGKRSLPPSQTWPAQPALEADASLCAPQRSVYIGALHTV